MNPIEEWKIVKYEVDKEVIYLSHQNEGVKTFDNPYGWYDSFEERMNDEFKDIPGTWSHELNEHFKAFSDLCWQGFNRCCEDMRKQGHENKIDRIKWREYVLWDMQKRHNDEKKE